MNRLMTPQRLTDVMSCVPPDWMGMRRLLFEAIQAWEADQETIETLRDEIQTLHNQLEDASPVSQEE